MTLDKRRQRQANNNKRRLVGSLSRAIDLNNRRTKIVTDSALTSRPVFTSEERAQFARLYDSLHNYNHAKCYAFYAKEAGHLDVSLF